MVHWPLVPLLLLPLLPLPLPLLPLPLPPFEKAVREAYTVAWFWTASRLLDMLESVDVLVAGLHATAVRASAAMMVVLTLRIMINSPRSMGWTTRRQAIRPLPSEGLSPRRSGDLPPSAPSHLSRD